MDTPTILYQGNPKTLQQPVLPDRLFDDRPMPDMAVIPNMNTLNKDQFKFCTKETTPAIGGNQFISPGVSYFLPDTMTPANRITSIVVDPFDRKNAADPVNETRLMMEKTWLDMSLSSRDSVATSLQMKNQWRDNMLLQAPMRTFGGGLFKKTSLLEQDQLKKQPSCF